MRDGKPAEAGAEPSPERFTVETRRPAGTDTDVLVLRGELDRDTAAPLRAALEERAGEGRIIVDCSGLGFCDSSGLNTLLRARLRIVEAGGRLDLVGLRPPVDRAFEITGVRAVFRTYETLSEALAEGGHDGLGGQWSQGGQRGHGGRDGHEGGGSHGREL
ncbi:STAS domain-containing protein [Streptomyces sp. NPDC059352]|uniref:STAS domain-containing protein n=1 Tax=Streptomyces sp. NPDC059352 TaxID=3346810 RepID=UPI0036BADD94